MRFGWFLLCSAALLAACGDDTTTVEVVEHWWAPETRVNSDGTKEFVPINLPPVRHAHPDVEGTERAWSTVINLTAERRIYWKTWDFDLAEESLDRAVLAEALVYGVKRYMDQLEPVPGKDGAAAPVMLMHADAGARWEDVEFLCRTLAAEPLGFRRFCIAVAPPGARGDHHWTATWHEVEPPSGLLEVQLRANEAGAVHVAAARKSPIEIPGPVQLESATYLKRANDAWSVVRAQLELRARGQSRVLVRARPGTSLLAAHVVTAMDLLMGLDVKEIVVPLAGGHLVIPAAPKVP